MATPVNQSTVKVNQADLMMSLRPSNDEEFPIIYADNQWDIAAAASKLAELALES